MSVIKVDYGSVGGELTKTGGTDTTTASGTAINVGKGNYLIVAATSAITVTNATLIGMNQTPDASWGLGYVGCVLSVFIATSDSCTVTISNGLGFLYETYSV